MNCSYDDIIFIQLVWNLSSLVPADTLPTLFNNARHGLLLPVKPTHLKNELGYGLACAEARGLVAQGFLAWQNGSGKKLGILVRVMI